MDHLRRYPEDLVPRSDGGFSLRAHEFWDYPSARSFAVVFLPKHGSRKGGIGKSGPFDVLVLYNLRNPGNSKYIETETRDMHDVIVHEMIHYLDPGRGKSKGTASRFDTGKLSAKQYYNDPGEWNAFWQEGAASLERMIRSGFGKIPRMREQMFGKGSFNDLLDRAHRHWDVTFLQNLNKKTRRKFEKRLYQLWKEMKDNGLL